MNTNLQQILDTPAPAFQANIRHMTRKEWAQEVRKLFKMLRLKGISVTSPSYSMAQSITIRLPELEVDKKEHEELHNHLYRYNLPSLDCADCRQRWEARQHAEKIVLSAFPDLSDRSDLQSDYFNYCLSFE